MFNTKEPLGLVRGVCVCLVLLAATGCSDDVEGVGSEFDDFSDGAGAAGSGGAGDPTDGRGDPNDPPGDGMDDDPGPGGTGGGNAGPGGTGGDGGVGGDLGAGGAGGGGSAPFGCPPPDEVCCAEGYTLSAFASSQPRFLSPFGIDPDASDACEANEVPVFVCGCNGNDDDGNGTTLFRFFTDELRTNQCFASCRVRENGAVVDEYSVGF